MSGVGDRVSLTCFARDIVHPTFQAYVSSAMLYPGSAMSKLRMLPVSIHLCHTSVLAASFLRGQEQHSLPQDSSALLSKAHKLHCHERVVPACLLHPRPSMRFYGPRTMAPRVRWDKTSVVLVLALTRSTSAQMTPRPHTQQHRPIRACTENLESPNDTISHH